MVAGKSLVPNMSSRNIWPWHTRTLKIVPCILEFAVIGLETLEVGKLCLDDVSVILGSMETTGGGVAHLDTKVGYLQNPAYPQVEHIATQIGQSLKKNWNDTSSHPGGHRGFDADGATGPSHGLRLPTQVKHFSTKIAIQYVLLTLFKVWNLSRLHYDCHLSELTWLILNWTAEARLTSLVTGTVLQ